SILISVGNTAPTATITSPLGTTTWNVGDVITFSGSATDAQDGTLPPSALSWSLILHHCPSNCHTHPVQDFIGVASGSFAHPHHDFPSYLELRLTATDSGGLTDTKSVILNPNTVALTFQSSPSGLSLVVGPTAGVTPFTATVIVGSRNSISAPSPQSFGATTYYFASWSDGGAASHDIVAPPPPATFIATYGTAASTELCGNTGAAVGFDTGDANMLNGPPCRTGTNPSGYRVIDCNAWVGSHTAGAYAKCSVYGDPQNKLCESAGGPVTASGSKQRNSLSSCPGVAPNTRDPGAFNTPRHRR